MPEQCNHNKHRVWLIFSPTEKRYVEFGPYCYEDEARAAFQRCYGYWPDELITSEPWDGKVDTTVEDEKGRPNEKTPS